MSVYSYSFHQRLWDGGGPISAKHFLGFNNVFCSRSIPWPLRILKGLPSPLEVAWRTRNEARCFEWDNHASSHTTASRGFGGPCVLGVPVSLQVTPPAAPEGSHLRRRPSPAARPWSLRRRSRLEGKSSSQQRTLEKAFLVPSSNP